MMIRTDAFGEGVLKNRERGVGVSRAAGIDPAIMTALSSQGAGVV